MSDLDKNEKIEFKIIKNLLEQNQRQKPPKAEDPIIFGKVHSDHMLVCDFIHDKGGWQEPKIIPFSPFQMDPDSIIFHYGQEIFEGMKAYRNKKKKSEILLFRPYLNAKRFYNSALRLNMEPVDPDFFMNCICELIKVDSDWVLPYPGALYIRPTLIALDQGLSYRSSKDYRFFIICCPVKSYYNSPQGLSVYVERNYVRAAVGGVGEAKCGGNYAASLYPVKEAKLKGADEVLWLDAKEHKYVEEVGTMNVMFVYEDKIITPKLSGSILQGITRDSLIKIADESGYKVEEREIDINQLIEDAKNKKLKEAFGCGTAVVVSPIGSFIDNEEKIPIGDINNFTVANNLKKNLTDLQTGLTADSNNWRFVI